MIVYWIAAALLSVLYIILSLPKRENGMPDRLIRLNRTIGMVGAGVFVLAFTAGALLIIWKGGEIRSWAWYVYLGFFEVSVPFSAVITAAVLISAFASKKGHGGGKNARRLRIASVIALEIVLLIIAPVFATLASNRIIPLYIPILFSGVGESLCMRLLLLPDLRPDGRVNKSQERPNP